MKTIKVHIIKLTTVLISFFYVFTPLHKEIKYVLHSISHTLEMPNNLTFHNYNENLNYKLKKSRNGFHEHKTQNLNAVLLEITNNHVKQKSPNIRNTKLYRHLRNLKYEFKNLAPTKPLRFIDSDKEKTTKPFYRKLNIPP